MEDLKIYASSDLVVRLVATGQIGTTLSMILVPCQSRLHSAEHRVSPLFPLRIHEASSNAM